MKILVTGANGYIGQGVVRGLLNHGHNVIAVDVDTKYIDKNAHIRKCDIFDIEEPFLYFDKPEMVIHLAWENGCDHFWNGHVKNLNAHYLFVKRFCRSDIRKIVITGSMHEVGKYEGAVDESTPCKPLSPYGISKNALRELAFWISNQYSVPIQWLRRYYIIGNNEFGNTIFSKIVQAVKRKECDFPLTSGTNKYDFLEYNDFCEKLILAAEQDQIMGIINVCSGKPERLIDCVEQFIKENDYDIKLKRGLYPERAYDSKALWGDAKKINQIEHMNLR